MSSLFCGFHLFKKKDKKNDKNEDKKEYKSFQKSVKPSSLFIKNIFSTEVTKQPSNEDYEYLDNIEYKDTEVFLPNITLGKVIKVYDGDTITIASKIYATSPIYRFNVRIRNIDSPEIKSNMEIEKILAIKSRDALHDLIFGKIVHLQNIETEKYGRILANVIFKDTDMNNTNKKEINVGVWMVNKNYAIPYNGKTKKRPEEWG